MYAALYGLADYSCNYEKEDLDCQLAAALHPEFRLVWLEECSLSRQMKVTIQAMEAAVETAHAPCAWFRQTREEGSGTNDQH